MPWPSMPKSICPSPGACSKLLAERVIHLIRNKTMKSDTSTIVGIPILNAPKVIGCTEVVGVNYDLCNLMISLTDEDKNPVLVVFQNVQGFRVLDERDLMEFWPEFSTPAGWAFRIVSGGWYDHEAKRVGCFLLPDVVPAAREFFFTGCNDCVSVIAIDEPQFVYQKEAE